MTESTRREQKARVERRMETLLGGEALWGINSNWDHPMFGGPGGKRTKGHHVTKLKVYPSLALLVTGSCLPPGF